MPQVSHSPSPSSKNISQFPPNITQNISLTLTEKSKQKSKTKSCVQMIKSFLIKRTQNLYKLNISDEEAFYWKFNRKIKKQNLSSLELIGRTKLNIKQQPVDFSRLIDSGFPILGYKTKDLVIFSEIILCQNQFFQSKIKNKEFLSTLITEISINYNIVPYHNFSHAFSLSLMLFQCFQYHHQLKSIYNPQQRFYALIAGLAHDINHPGTNNTFEIKTQTLRASQFNGLSVLENFHVTEFWRLLRKNERINLLEKTENPKYAKKLITQLILATDIAQHFKNLDRIKLINESMKDLSQIEKGCEKNEESQFFLSQLFHACDIGNPCIDFEIYIQWAALLSYEFHQQTIQQQQMKEEVSQPLRYRDLQTFYKAQLNFINLMVLPLWKQIVILCRDLSFFVQNAQKNSQILLQKIEIQHQKNRTQLEDQVIQK